MPAIRSRKHLRRILHASPDHLVWLRSADRSYYWLKETPKKSGNIRETYAAKDKRLAAAQRAIHKFFAQDLCSDISFGSIKGRSPAQAAQRVAGRCWVGTIDVEDFFPSIGSGLVFKTLNELGCTPKSAADVVNICCLDDKLIQGSPASPTLANLVLGSFDDDILAFARAHSIDVIRYVDDIVFAGEDRNDVQRVMDYAIGSLRSRRLLVKRNKITLVSRSRQQVVLGLMVNCGRPNIGNRRKGGVNWLILRSNVRAAIRANDPNNERSLRSKIMYAAQFDPQRAEKFLAMLRRPT